MSDNTSYQFVDSNILVYAHDLSAGSKFVKAQDLIRSLWETKTGCLSIQVMQEFYITVTQKVPHPLDYSDAARIIHDLSYWRIHEPAPKDILDAIIIQQQSSISFWDAMIVQSAVRLGCQVIWSEDLNPGQAYQGIKLIDPFQLQVEGFEVNQ